MLMTTTLSWACRLIWILLLAGRAYADLNNDTSPTHIFKSRPDIHAPIIDMTILRPELLYPGYIFMAPYRNIAPGPYIYDNFGELVWSGAGSSGPKTAHMPHVCQYKGKDHICYYQGDQHHGFARGFGVIMDNSYRIVKTVESVGAGASSDMHEFRLTPFSNGKTALVTVYQTQPYDLTIDPRFNLRNGIGWIIDAVFQEIDIDTGRLLFEWRSLDHVDPSFSWVMPGTTDTSGNGLDAFTAWDYFHINSVDKNRDGDYLISARHTGGIYKISGVDGHIIWQLGGVEATIEHPGFAFGYQHEVRWVSENSTHTVLSFFDNSGNDKNRTSPWSSGVVVAIDHTIKTASLLQSWGAPEPRGGLRSVSQGNMQMLPHGGCHIAWGEHAYISEHTADGSAVMYGKLAKRESNVMIYRSGKYAWTGHPLTDPAMWAFSRSGDNVSGTRFWISWNGATEVRYWRFYIAADAIGPFDIAGEIPKHGFESSFHLPIYSRWSYAEALDVDRKALGRTPVVRSFTPSPSLIGFCDELGCQNNEAVSENETVPYDKNVDFPSEYMSWNRGFNTAQYYMDSMVHSSSWSWTNRTTSSPGILWLVLCAAGVLLLSFGATRRALGATFGDILRRLVALVASCLGRKMDLAKKRDNDAWELLSTTSSRS